MERLEDEQLQRVYAWVDEVPLSRPKRNIARDFSDGVLVAEIIGHYFPKLVDLHNYPGCNAVQQKLANWRLINKKLLRRLKLQLVPSQMEDLAACKAGEIEVVLLQLLERIQKLEEARNEKKRQENDSNNQESSEEALKNGAEDDARDEEYIEETADEDKIQATLAEEREKEKDEQINQLNKTVEILQVKISKLEQLLRLKDSRIQALTAKLNQM